MSIITFEPPSRLNKSSKGPARIIYFPKHLNSNDFHLDFRDPEFRGYYEEHPDYFMRLWERLGLTVRDRLGRPVPLLLVANHMSNTLEYALKYTLKYTLELNVSAKTLWLLDDRYSRSIFHYFALYPDPKWSHIANSMWLKGIRCSFEDLFGRTPLHYAALRANRGYLDFALEHYNQADNDNLGRSAMYYAVFYGDDWDLFNRLSVPHLLRNKDIHGRTVMDWAVKLGRKEIEKNLEPFYEVFLKESPSI